MAFPSVVTRSTGTANAAAITVTLPSGSADGDLIFILLRANSESTTWTQTTGTTGWTEITGSDANGQVSVFKQIGASEANPSFDSSTGSERLGSIALRITGHEDPATQAPERSVVSTGTSTGPNPAAVTPTGGAKDYLFIATGSTGDGRRSFDSLPFNYTDLTAMATAGGANGCTAGTAERQFNTTSENPNAFTISASALWSAHVVAVHPPAVATQGRHHTESFFLGGRVRGLVGGNG